LIVGENRVSKSGQSARKHRVKVHVTSNGGRYVDAEELLRSEAGRRALKDMQVLFKHLKPAAKNPASQGNS